MTSTHESGTWDGKLRLGETEAPDDDLAVAALAPTFEEPVQSHDANVGHALFDLQGDVRLSLEVDDHARK